MRNDVDPQKLWNVGEMINDNINSTLNCILLITKHGACNRNALI